MRTNRRSPVVAAPSREAALVHAFALSIQVQHAEEKNRPAPWPAYLDAHRKLDAALHAPALTARLRPYITPATACIGSG